MTDELILLCNKYGVPVEIVKGIYSIEVSYRPFWFRWIEYIALIGYSILFIISFSNRIPNLTIGRFQIGLSIIQNYFNNELPVHKVKAISPPKKELLKILSYCIGHRNNIIAIWWISKLYSETSSLSPSRAHMYVGTRYNGSLDYGFLLTKIIK